VLDWFKKAEVTPGPHPDPLPPPPAAPISQFQSSCTARRKVWRGHAATLTLPEINYFKPTSPRATPLGHSSRRAAVRAKLNNKLLFLCGPMKCGKFNGAPRPCEYIVGLVRHFKVIAKDQSTPNTPPE